MKHLIFLRIIFLTVIVNLLSCCPKVMLNDMDNNKLNWKNLVCETFIKEYVQYKKYGFRSSDSCYHSTLDIYYKIADINRYPFDIGFDKLKSEVELKKIKFDSIMCVGTQSSGSFDPEYLYPNYFYVFRNGKLIHVFIFDPYSFDLTSSDDTLSNLEEMYLTDNNKTDGDDLSLLIFTKIKPDWEFEINKFVINSY